MKIPKLRWFVAAMLFLSAVINYVDRQTLSILAPVLTKELRLSDADYANILLGFQVAYTMMYLISGIVVDRWGTRVALGTFMAWWSAANMLHAFARSAFGLGAFRMLLGIGEPGNFMAASKATSEWFPPRERAFVNGLANSGASVGAIVAPPLIVMLWQWLGWRSAFVFTGASGFLWLAVWMWLYRLPEEHPHITEEEKLLLRETDPAKAKVRVRWLDLLQFRQTWGLFWSRFLSDPVWWFYLFWLPKYLHDQRGFSMKEIGLLAWIPYLAADLGAISGGVLSGWLVKRGWRAIPARRAGMWPFALAMPVSLLIVHATTHAAVLALISVVTFAHMAWKTNQMTLTNDVYPAPVVGSVAGLAAFGNGLGGAVFTWMTGQIVGRFGYSSIFLIMGFLHPAAYLVVRWLVREPAAISSPSPITE